MEVIADLDLEPKTEMDNSFRNSQNGEYYYKYLGEEDIDELSRLYHGLALGRVNKHEVHTYLKDKFGMIPQDTSLMFSYIAGTLLDLIESENNNPYQLEKLV